MFEFEIHSKFPSIYKDVEEFKKLDEIEQEQLDSAKDKGNDFIANNFAVSMKEYGLTRTENFLDLVSYEGMTVQQRRDRLIALYNTMLPFTYKYLIQSLKRLTDENGFYFYQDFANYKLTVFVKNNFDNVIQYLTQIMPLNIEWSVSLEVPHRVDISQNATLICIKTLHKSFS